MLNVCMAFYSLKKYLTTYIYLYYFYTCCQICWRTSGFKTLRKEKSIMCTCCWRFSINRSSLLSLYEKMYTVNYKWYKEKEHLLPYVLPLKKYSSTDKNKVIQAGEIVTWSSKHVIRKTIGSLLLTWFRFSVAHFSTLRFGLIAIVVVLLRWNLGSLELK